MHRKDMVRNNKSADFAIERAADKGREGCAHLTTRNAPHVLAHNALVLHVQEVLRYDGFGICFGSGDD